MIEVRNLTKTFSELTALSLPELSIKENGVVAVVGNNGAGKTTFLRILINLVQPTTGGVTYFDNRNSVVNNRERYFSAYLDETFLIDFLTVKEYFNFILSINNLPHDSLSSRLVPFEKFLPADILTSRKKIQDLSSGNKNKIGVAGAFLCDKDIVILDEPFANIDPFSQHLLIDFFETIKKNKQKLLILSSHNLESIQQISSRIILIDKGKIIQDETTSYAAVHTIKNRLLQ